jgi:calcineurin-like phosphoesterase family protein
MFLSHVPIHTESLGRWKINVHGHLHAGYVRLSNGTPDTRYVSVCMEKLDDYMPISLEQLKAKHL